MSKQSLGGDLCVFEEIEGFEESDDCALVALLDDLHGDTLLALLDDNLFVKELCEHPFEGADENVPFPGKSFSSPVSNGSGSESSLIRKSLDGIDESSYLRSPSSAKSSEAKKRLRSDSVCGDLLKKARLGEERSTCVAGYNSALSCVMHDHCYTSACEDHRQSLQNNGNTSNEEESSKPDTMCHDHSSREDHHQSLQNSNSDGETSNEESSSSDAGKDLKLAQ